MATVSGMVRASVLYLPETGGCLRHMELSVPFTCQVEAPGLTSQGTISVSYTHLTLPTKLEV